jgi:hypothetical protein
MSSCPSISLIGANRDLIPLRGIQPFLMVILSITVRSRDADPDGTFWAKDRSEERSHQLSFELFAS